jgi:predicted transcriptional regulator
MATRKLDKTDLEQLNTLQESYQRVTSQIATCTIDIELLSEQLQELETEKKFQMRQFKDLQQQESDLISSLKQKYGDGEINLTEGIFISQD